MDRNSILGVAVDVTNRLRDHMLEPVKNPDAVRTSGAEPIRYGSVMSTSSLAFHTCLPLGHADRAGNFFRHGIWRS